MNRSEQEYRDALDSLRFSDEGKERIMKNLMEQQEAKPVKWRNIRPLRAGLIAAGLCILLVGTVAAAGMIEYDFDVSGGLISGYGADGANFTVRVPGGGGSPIILEDNRLWLLVSEDQRVDVTDLIDEATPKIYPYTDPESGDSAFLVIGGTTEYFGWAVVIPKGGNGDWGGSGGLDCYAEKNNILSGYAPWLRSALEQLGLRT